MGLDCRFAAYKITKDRNVATTSWTIKHSYVHKMWPPFSVQTPNGWSSIALRPPKLTCVCDLWTMTSKHAGEPFLKAPNFFGRAHSQKLVMGWIESSCNLLTRSTLFCSILYNKNEFVDFQGRWSQIWTTTKGQCQQMFSSDRLWPIIISFLVGAERAKRSTYYILVRFCNCVVVTL
jgi:hypothetical protein